MCGPVRSRPDGPVERVVVAGGRKERLTTEIYDVANDSWSEGTPIPLALTGAAVVPYKSTFLVIGGKIGDDLYSDKVFLYAMSGEWQELTNMKLSEARAWLTAMLVPSSLLEQTCVNPGQVYPNCSTCINSQLQPPHCVECIDSRHAFPNCSTCINSRQQFPDCQQCIHPYGIFPICTQCKLTFGATIKY